MLLDGRDLRSLSLTWYRARVGLVSQEPTLFATTIARNIAAFTNASASEIVAASEAANAHSFIMNLPLKCAGCCTCISSSTSYDEAGHAHAINGSPWPCPASLLRRLTKNFFAGTRRWSERRCAACDSVLFPSICPACPCINWLLASAGYPDERRAGAVLPVATAVLLC